MKKLAGITTALLIALSIGFLLGINTQTVTAQEKKGYKVVRAPAFSIDVPQKLEKFFNDMADKGWELDMWQNKSGLIIFKKAD